MSSPVPPSPPIISRYGRDEDELKSSSSRSHHRTARDYRASRSPSRGRGRPSPRRHRQRTHSRSRSRDTERRRPKLRSRSRSRSRDKSRRHRVERSPSRHRHDRSTSRSRVRSERRRRSSYRSRSRSYTRLPKTSLVSRSRSRSHSRSRRRNNRSRSGSKHTRVEHTSSSQSKRRHEDKPSKPKVIVLSTESYKDSLKSSSKLPPVSEEPSSSSSSSSSSAAAKPPPVQEETPSWKTTKVDQVGVYSNLEPDAPIDKEKIQKEIEEKLRLALAREGKVYPHPKPEPSHPVFANDGSFLEIFKKMQQQQTFVQQQVGESVQIHAVPNTAAASIAPSPAVAPAMQHHPPPPQLPIFGRRRGGKILKTGVVAKPTSSNDTDTGDVKDFWSIYLREVKKYKSTACESESKTRPLVR